MTLDAAKTARTKSVDLAGARQEFPDASSIAAPALPVQRRVAMCVIVLPFFGTVAAVALASRQGLHAWDLELLAGMYVLTMFGITAGFHRHFAHRAFRTSRFVQTLLVILGSMCVQGPLFFWVTAHRRHHAYSDGPGDPHSPNLFGESWQGRLRGFWYSHMGWMLEEDVSQWSRFTRDLLQSRYLIRMHELYPVWVLLGLVLPAGLGGMLTRTWGGALEGLLWGGFARIFFVNQAAWCVGSVCHMFGARSFPTPDRSGNVRWVAWLTFGEGMQNNHHAFPSSAMHALRWWEPDFSGWMIRILERLGVVWDVKFPSKAVQAAAKKRDFQGLDPRMQGIL